MEKNSQSFYYHADGLGSITEITSQTGTVVQRYIYSSFGKMESQLDANFLQPYSYTSREFDPETGLHYYRARFYDSVLGRFLQEDPIRFAGGLNFYAYVSNNPVVLSDPLGLCPGDRKKCMEKFLRDNYGDFVADKLIPSFSVGSLLTDTWEYLKSAVEALAVKGGIAYGIGAVGGYLVSRGYDILARPASSFGAIFGLYARAEAAASSFTAGAVLSRVAALGAEGVAMAGWGVGWFATVAQSYAYLHCQDQDP